MRRISHLALGAVLLVASCAGSPVAAVQQSTAGHIVSTTLGSKGSVFFVSDKVGWVLTIPPDSLRMVIYRTSDGGGHWRIWGLAPEVATPIAFGANEVVFSSRGCPSACDQVGVLRSNDGAHWTFLPTPTGDAPFFLPDLQHGWIFGFVPEPPCDTCIPAGKGKGGPPPPPPPSAVWYTADGGITWSKRTQGNFGDAGGQLVFWTSADGILTQRPGGGSAQTLLATHDGGVSWHQLTFNFPPPLSAEAFVSDSHLTMFDGLHGRFELLGADYQPQTTPYISRTDDGGRTWSPPEPLAGCAPCGGELYFMDARRWLASDKGLFITSDAGLTWRAVATTIAAKDASAVEVTRPVPGTVVVLEPGVMASMTNDWGAHWRAVGLPQIYQSYRGLNGAGGWPFCCI